jgi:hypothetical protein
MQMDKEEAVDAQEMAVIITTSPIRSNPATEVIDMALESIEKEPTLRNVIIYIICDGVKLT